MSVLKYAGYGRIIVAGGRDSSSFLSSLCTLVFWSFAVITVLWASRPANARTVCGDRDTLLERLDKSYAEKRQALGLSGDGGGVEVLTSPSGSWTILITYPNRPTCIVAAGKAWEDLAKVVGQPT